MNKIAVIGTGYVGLVSGSCLADFGLNVMCIDKDMEKIRKLNQGIVPIFEPGLDEIIKRNVYYKRLSFSTDIKAAVEGNEIILIAVGTPRASNGGADLTSIFDVAREIGKYMNGHRVIVDKSTVPVGTGQRVKKIIQKELNNRGVDHSFDIVSNPEFLREGAAIQDFTHPDRIVIGAESERAFRMIKEVYSVLYLNETPFVISNIETAEMAKYASNAFLAAKITFINELSELCERVGADVQQVAKAMGMDERIGRKYLHVGPGYGGSCFPKDTQAILNTAREQGCTLSIIESTVKANENQKLKMVSKIIGAMGGVANRKLGILGLAFKPDTDDIREAPALTIIRELAAKGAVLKVYDPKAISQAKKELCELKDKIEYCEDEYQAVRDVEGLIIITEWNQFRNLDLDLIKGIVSDVFFFDLRNIYDRETVEKKGFKYFSVGR